MTDNDEVCLDICSIEIEPRPTPPKIPQPTSSFVGSTGLIGVYRPNGLPGFSGTVGTRTSGSTGWSGINDGFSAFSGRSGFSAFSGRIGTSQFIPRPTDPLAEAINTLPSITQVPLFEIATNPQIRLSEIRQRRFTINADVIKPKWYIRFGRWIRDCFYTLTGIG